VSREISGIVSDTSSDSTATANSIPSYDLLGETILNPSIGLPPSHDQQLFEPAHPSSYFTKERIASELTRQFPSLSSEEILIFSLEVEEILNEWTYPDSKITFHRTKLTEKFSGESITVLDFECLDNSHFAGDNDRSLPQPLLVPHRHQYAGFLIVLRDTDFDRIEIPSYFYPYGSKPDKFSVSEREILLKVLTWNRLHDDGIHNAITIDAICRLYKKDFRVWSPQYKSVDSAIQRACAWGLWMARKNKTNYSFFATCAALFLNMSLETILRGDVSEIVPVDTKLNDLSYVLTPFFEIDEQKIGMIHPCSVFR
jgi:hypothetical protein